MQTLPEALAPLAAYKQFILYKLVWDETKKKHKKIPINPFSRKAFPKGSDWQKDPTKMSDFATASANCIEGYGVGFLFTPQDPFFFLDIDKCLNPDGRDWSPLAHELMQKLPGAAIEVSQSGAGLHIFGRGLPPEGHANRNDFLHLELYTEWRFAALTGVNAVGSADTQLAPNIFSIAEQYFKKRAEFDRADWTSEACPQWRGPQDDATLIEKMLAAKSANALFNDGKSNFQALWGADEDLLSKLYPDSDRTFDASRADSALAQHLAYWTGNNCDRILSLMWQSGLVRDKWTDREEYYLDRTILRAIALQKEFYCEVDLSIPDQYGAGKIDASSDAQREYAERIRAEIVAKAAPEDAKTLCQTRTNAQFWLDCGDKTPSELAAMLRPLDKVEPSSKITSAETVSGFQYLPVTLQLEKFAGCVYVSDLHKIWSPNGLLLNESRFNALNGGYVYPIDDMGRKSTVNAWDAFLNSQCIRFPKAHTSTFDPLKASGEVIEEEGLLSVNTYVPLETRRLKGDVSPFLNHLEKLIPLESDRAILLAYMAAVIQHKGVKFQWAPLIQGAPGNGKTLFTMCLMYAVGSRYSYMPKAKELTNKFNTWLVGNIFIGVEDIYVTESRKEVLEELKPMITSTRQEVEGKGADQYNTHICCNFILNSNHKDAIRKTLDDRRFAVFYTRQQTALDIARDGLDGNYFPDLYGWLNVDGYAIVNDFLQDYVIPDELNPATKAHRAPLTSSTEEAVNMGMGGVEQEILEAIEEGRPGFAGGWVSSVALDRMLREIRAEKAIPRNRRREVMQSLGYDYHPALKDGRVNSPIQMDENKKPRLFVKRAHISLNQTNPPEVVEMYMKAQGIAMNVGATPFEAIK